MIYSADQYRLRRRQELGISWDTLGQAVGVHPVTLRAKLCGLRQPFEYKDLKMIDQFFSDTERRRIDGHRETGAE